MKILNQSLALLLSLSCYQAAASNSNNSIILTPNTDYELTTVVGYISTYVTCMDNAQQQFQQQNDIKSNIGYSSVFNNAQQTQCDSEYQQLRQSIDAQSLQSIDRITWQRWRKPQAIPRFYSESMSKKPAALTRGIERHTIKSIISGVKQ